MLLPFQRLSGHGVLWARLALRAIGVLLFALWTGAAAIAQDYPQKSVRLVVPYAAGGGIDGLARAFADTITKIWNVPVVVDNRAGAGGAIGADIVAHAAPDGYTLLFTADAPITSSPYMIRKMAYDPMKDLLPISLLVMANTVVTVNPSVNVSNLRELVALAKQKPDELTYASFGIGSPSHLFFETLKAESGAQIRHIPYKGAVVAGAAVMSGEVQTGMLGVGTLPLIQSGRMKLIAFCGLRRLPLMPDVQTCAEAGFAKADPASWAGLMAPAGTSPALIAKIHDGAVKALSSPEILERGFDSNAFTRVGSTPAAFAQTIREDFEAKGRMIRAAGIVPE